MAHKIWNFSKILYFKNAKILEKTSISSYETYSKPKWQWQGLKNYSSSQKLTAHLQNGNSTPQNSDNNNININNNDTIQTPNFIWNRINSIKLSEEYKTFCAVESRKTSDFSNSGVTVHVSKPAVEMTGDQKLRRLRLMLDSFPITRGEIQIMFHEKFIQSCLPIIYRGEWEHNFDNIMKKNRIKEIFLERVLICPRRFGKSVGVALFAAACLLVIPNHTITIFSRGKRMAQKLMLQCIKFALSSPGFSAKIISCTTEKIEILFGTDDTRVLCNLPGSTEVRI